ncbi:aldehyde dehydrogenase family protein [Pseudomonas putida]|uniref:aldehyde dehydrogenase family protein n=2 Tax=Pseudomonas sp. FW305-E2 TaxID=2075558 RepID=UPI00269A2C87|nr:aldehyde dehydrogenase family protein [Pseudomonas putida]
MPTNCVLMSSQQQSLKKLEYLSVRVHKSWPINHMKVARDLLKSYAFESRVGAKIVRREPIGVCALISPWNWPIQTKVIKVIYALAAGCTVVSKPSVNSPISAILLAEVLHEAGVPNGVFNLLNGPGRVIGEAMSSHPDVDISFVHWVYKCRQSGRASRSTDHQTCLP